MHDFDNTATPEDILLVESIARDHLGAVDSTPINIPVGSVNKVFRVACQNKLYIFRLSQDDNKDKLKEYEKERWCAEQAREAGVPTPAVLKIGTYENSVFMIQSFVDGKPCTDDSLNQSKIWQSFGSHLAGIHSIKTTGYGPNLLDGSSHSFAESWDQWVDHNIHAIHPEDVLLKRGYVNKQEHAVLKSCFESIKDTAWQFGLCHGDVSLRNAIWGEDGQVTMIDWGSARSAIVPFFDFAQIIKSEQPTLEHYNLFLNAYGIQQQSDSEIQNKTNQIALYAATDTLRWAIDHKVFARNRYIASLRWALDLYLEKINWFSHPYHEAYGL